MARRLALSPAAVYAPDREAEMACVFCDRLAAAEILVGNPIAAAFPDAFPVSPGHTLIVPRRHEPDFLALTEPERPAVWALVEPVRQAIDAQFHPDGYNLGVNVGEATGQTVVHAHLHVIPRYAGDTADPRGGIRWILPARRPTECAPARHDHGDPTRL